ncbi:hypothetical protein C7Y66_10715 [Chroococcidiopsis sp. CCALA 051]|uniref:sensor histidine kinase n=1 Tax=Chroococcidiopsis sp. CCALA 051 TaxID=869949 RepID=UPI000D0C9D5F|nr:ATP-binding protein [Chroococcidiopsis sp. CCALA 051]MBE9016706.1 PAS domain-containing protein [Chroococcidiopsidales cyanobacterium LEGE 13417]PSM49190.1 hypothetical protein C7Y66_10715 [Chroococcidiopsis sp. CCALA 051]
MLSSLLLGANSVIAVCYFAISFLIFQGLRRGQKHLLKNPLVLATVIIFFTCAVGHSVHVVGGIVDEQYSQLTMQVQVVVDLLTASIAVIYFALRRQYSLLVDGPLLLAQTQSQLAKAIAELAHAKGNLENAVVERTTELLHANQQLDELLGREQKARQEVTELLESISDAFFALDGDWRFTYINSQAENLLQRSPDELLNRQIWFEFPAIVGTVFEREYRRAATEQVTVQFEEFFAPLDKWLGVRVYPAANGLSVYLQDITERKQEQALLQELNQNLEQRVTERTSQLAAANKELEAFSYSVSHDLRAPLRSIDGFSLALLERCTHLDEKGKHYLQRIRAASQRMGELIEELLHLSRVTRSEMRLQNLDLSAMVRNIASELQQAQPERVVEFAIAPNITAPADPQLIRVLFENLLNNAWKFTSRTKSARIEFGKLPLKQLKFFTERSLSPFNSSNVYFISDNGAGFDMAYSARLFVAFQRLHSEDEFPGNGIGLATVKRIILRHGGQIWAESIIGRGTTFFFTLR